MLVCQVEEQLEDTKACRVWVEVLLLDIHLHRLVYRAIVNS